MALKGSMVFAVAACMALAGCKKKKEAPAPPPPTPPAQVQPAETASPKGSPSEPVPPPVPAGDAVENESPMAWVIHSADGAATLKQLPGAPGKCALECRLGDGSTAWQAMGGCMGEKADRKFLANDCVRTVVMIPAPLRSESWRKAQVMRVYKREKLDYPVVGAAVLPEKFIKGSRSWLKGCYGVPGDEPRYSADGLAVEYESIDGKKGKVPLAAK